MWLIRLIAIEFACRKSEHSSQGYMRNGTFEIDIGYTVIVQNQVCTVHTRFRDITLISVADEAKCNGTSILPARQAEIRRF